MTLTPNAYNELCADFIDTEFDVLLTAINTTIAYWENAATQMPGTAHVAAEQVAQWSKLRTRLEDLTDLNPN